MPGGIACANAEQVSVITTPPASLIAFDVARAVAPRSSTARDVKIHRLQLPLTVLPSSNARRFLELLERRMRAAEHHVVDVRIAARWR